MRTAKILTGILGGIAVLAMAALLAVWWLVSPNAYKDRLVAVVRESTGRDLSVAGAIKLSIFPRVALELGPASLGSPPGFGSEPFLNFRHATVRVKLWPLLHDRLELAGVEIDGLDVRLRRNAAGRGNWENDAPESEGALSATEGGAPGGARAPSVAEGAPSGEGKAGGGIGHSLLNLAGIRVSHGRIEYRDTVLDHLQLEFGAVTEDGVLPVTTAFDADLGRQGAHASVNGKFALSVDAAGRKLRVAAVSWSGLASHPGGSQPTHWEVSAPAIEVDLAQRSVRAPAFAMRYLGAQVNGALEARTAGDDWGVSGSVALAPLLLREFLPRLGIVVPRIQDPHALSEFSASSDFKYDAGGVHLGKIEAHLDDTLLHGSVAISSGEGRAVKFDLAADRIDVDRYLGVEGGSAGAAASGGSGGDAAQRVDAAALDAEGTLNVASLRVAKLDFSSVKLTIDARDEVVHLYPAQGLIDGGRYSGDITYDRSGEIPRLSLDEHLSEVDVRRLLGDSAGRNRLSGRGNVSLKGSAQGSGAEALLASLNGHLEASLVDGAIEGVDLSHELGLAQALLTRSRASGAEDTRRTKFDTFRMSADIAHGVASIRDLTIASQALRVTGVGSTNLSSKAIDFKVLASISTPSARIGDIPLRITGTYADPTVRPDLDTLVKGELKHRLQDVLRDTLPGLFGKP